MIEFVRRHGVLFLLITMYVVGFVNGYIFYELRYAT